VGDDARMAGIRENFAEGLDQAEPLFGLPQKQEAAVSGDVAVFKRGFDFSAIKAGKIKSSLSTVWHWRGFFGSFFNAMNHSGLPLKPRQYFAQM